MHNTGLSPKFLKKTTSINSIKYLVLHNTFKKSKQIYTLKSGVPNCLSVYVQQKIFVVISGVVEEGYSRSNHSTKVRILNKNKIMQRVGWVTFKK